MSNVYQLDEKVVTELIKTIDDNTGNTEDILIFYDGNGNILYRKGSSSNQLWEQIHSTNELVWRLSEREGIHYLDTLVQLKLGERIYYIEKNRSVQKIYDNRNILLEKYRMIVGILMLVASGFAALLAYSFTEPIRKLSNATKAFAEGNYSSRVNPTGRDEITVLMKEFNAMAGQLEENIWELNDAVRRQEFITFSVF